MPKVQPAVNPPLIARASETTARRSGFATGNDRRIRLSTREKIAVFAPMPSASERMATAVTIGVARRERTARRRSCTAPPVRLKPDTTKSVNRRASTIPEHLGGVNPRRAEGRKPSRERADGAEHDGGANQRQRIARLEPVEERRDELRRPHADAGA